MKLFQYISIYLIITLVFISCSKDKFPKEQKESFVKFYGTAGVNSGVDVLQTSDGGFMILATINPENTGSKISIIKTDVYGNKSWGKQYGDSLPLTAACIEPFNNGYIVLGTKTQNSNSNFFIISLNNSGDTLFTKNFGTSLNDYAEKVIVTNDGNLLIIGSCQTSSTGKDGYWALLNKTGEIIWSHTSNTLGDDNYQSAVETSAGYLLIGSTSDPLWVQGSSDFLISLIKTNGDVAFSSNIGYSGADYGTDVLALSDESFICVGTSTPMGKTYSEISLFSVNVNLMSKTINWQKAFSQTNVSYTGQSISKDATGNFWITGTATLNDASLDMVVLKTDNSGNKLWLQTYGETGNQSSNKIIANTDNGAAFTGSNSIGTNSLISLLKITTNGKLE